MQHTSGRTAVITGGTRGFGLALARAFLADGYNIVVASRRKRNIDAALQKLNADQKAAGFACDVTKQQDIESLRDFTLQRYKKFEVWINNAGIAGPYGPTIEISPRTFQQVLKTNILGTYFGSYVACRYFTSTGYGKLINILGQGWNAPTPYQVAYGSSKYWIRSFTLALAKECKQKSGISIFAFQPGMMLTNLITDLEVVAGYEEKIKVFPKIVRLLAVSPDKPAKKVLRLASSASDSKTGKLVRINPYFSMLQKILKGFGNKEERADIEIEITSVPPVTD